MKNINLKTIKKIYFVGIGGIGMSALARMMVHEGKDVIGTNDIPSPATLDGLRAQGVSIYLDRDISHIDDVDVIVYSVAWDQNEKEFMKEVKALGKPVLTYFEMLGLVSKDRFTVAVAGTHGKTTTTAMLAHVLLSAEQSPTVVVGSLMNLPDGSRSNYIPGDSNLFVAEACEYRRNFLHLHPNILVITNIEEDHLDYYKDLADIQSAFRELAEKVPEDGAIVCDTESEAVKKVVEGLSVRIIDYNDLGEEVELPIPGEHNRENARAAVSAAQLVQVNRASAIEALKGFKGTWRRSEFKGKLPGGALLYDSYAHHPTEVKMTLRGFREKFPEKKILVIFQPHLYSRTKFFLDEFAESFSDADETLVLPIYAAREEKDESINSKMLAEKIGEKAKHIDTFEKVAEEIKKSAHGDCVVITMGAGDVYKIGESLQADL